jgi:hypothetical protein
MMKEAVGVGLSPYKRKISENKCFSEAVARIEF